MSNSWDCHFLDLNIALLISILWEDGWIYIFFVYAIGFMGPKWALGPSGPQAMAMAPRIGNERN
jgi:hypothetical protein